MERLEPRRGVDITGGSDQGEVFDGVAKGDLGCAKFDFIGILRDQPADLLAQDRPDQDVSVEDDALGGHASCFALRRVSNSATTSSSSRPISTRRSFAFFAAAA